VIEGYLQRLLDQHNAESRQRSRDIVAQFRRLRELQRAAPSATPAPQATVILALGNRQYRIGTTPPLTVSEREDTVLQAFLRPTPLAAMDSPMLAQRCGYADGRAILARLREKYNGVLANAIELPGGKSKGGYRVRITNA
jgi:hypothetical protein